MSPSFHTTDCTSAWGGRRGTHRYLEDVFRFLFRPKWIAFHLLCLAGIIGMLLLSRWQFDRLDQRRDFNAEVRERTSEPVLDLSKSDSLQPTELQWRPVGAKGEYLNDEQVLIVNRSQDGRAGSNVVTPLRLEDGRIVLVIRGFIGLDDTAPDAPSGTVRVLGTARLGEQRRTGQSAEASGELTEFLRLDIDRIAQQLDGDVLGFAIAAEASDPADDPSLTPVALPELTEGPHLSYAIQWIIFSIAVLVGWVLTVRVSLRRSTRSTPSA